MGGDNGVHFLKCDPVPIFFLFLPLFGEMGHGERR